MLKQVLLLVSFLFFFTVNSLLAQTALDTKISVNLKGTSMSQLLSEIESKAGVSFMYEDKLIDVAKEVKLIAHNESVYNILRQVFPNPEIAFTCMNNQIIIHKRKVTDSSAPQIKIPKNVKPKYVSVYDTISVMVFDTLVTQVSDTTIVLVYDTLVHYIKKTQASFSDIQWRILPAIELRTEKYSGSDEFRNASEKNLPGFAIQIQAFKKVNDLRIGTGIKYRQLHTKMSYDYSKQISSISTDTIYYNNSYYEYFLNGKYIQTSFGDSVYVRYSDSIYLTETEPQVVSVESTETATYKNSGTYSIAYISLPLYVQFSLLDKNKYTLSLEYETDLSFNIYRSKLYNNTSFNAVSPNFEIKNFMWFNAVGIDYEYKLNSKYSLLSIAKLAISTQNIYKLSEASNYRIMYTVGLGLLLK